MVRQERRRMRCLWCMQFAEFVGDYCDACSDRLDAVLLEGDLERIQRRAVLRRCGFEG